MNRVVPASPAIAAAAKRSPLSRESPEIEWRDVADDFCGCVQNAGWTGRRCAGHESGAIPTAPVLSSRLRRAY